MIINNRNRPALMGGLVSSDLWDRYSTVLGSIGSARLRSNSYKFFTRDTLVDSIPGESRWKYTQMNPTYLSGLGADETTGSDIGDLIKQGIMAWNTQTIANANAERMARGLAPLDASAYAPTVNMGLNSQTMLLIGAGVLALFMLGKRR